MAYLGIREKDENENGVYYFSSLGMRDDVGEKFERASYYYDKEKELALKDFCITENEIRDGFELIRKYIHNNDKRHTKDSKYYLGLVGTPFDGVYVFNYKTPRDNMAEKFDNTYISDDKKDVMEHFDIVEADIKDASLLFEDRVHNYLRKRTKKVVESPKVKATEIAVTPVTPATSITPVADKVETKKSEPIKAEVVKAEAVKTNKEVEVNEITENVKKKKGNLIKQMIDEVKKENDIVELIFSNGYLYRLALRDTFYVRNGVSFQNCAKTIDGEVTINSAAIDKLIDNGDIIHIKRTAISHSEDFTVCVDCDDNYSPNVDTDECGRFNITHYIPKIVFNADEVVSVKGLSVYPEIAIDFVKIVNSSQKLVYDYLRKKYN